MENKVTKHVNESINNLLIGLKKTTKIGYFKKGVSNFTRFHGRLAPQLKLWRPANWVEKEKMEKKWKKKLWRLFYHDTLNILFFLFATLFPYFRNFYQIFAIK